MRCLTYSSVVQPTWRSAHRCSRILKGSGSIPAACQRARGGDLRWVVPSSWQATGCLGHRVAFDAPALMVDIVVGPFESRQPERAVLTHPSEEVLDLIDLADADPCAGVSAGTVVPLPVLRLVPATVGRSGPFMTRACDTCGRPCGTRR
jgi:hypothetical protein